MMLFLGASRAMAMSSANMRVPLIRFRYGHNRLAGSQTTHVAASTQQHAVQSVVHTGGSAVAIDETELPARFHRRVIPEDEIEYINRGGPA